MGQNTSIGGGRGEGVNPGRREEFGPLYDREEHFLWDQRGGARKVNRRRQERDGEKTYLPAEDPERHRIERLKKGL